MLLCIVYTFRLSVPFSDNPLDNQEYDENRKDICHINANPSGHFQTLSRICLFHIAVKAPPVPGHAEQQIAQGANRQYQITDQKILQIENRAALSQRLDCRPQIVAEHTGKR